jgi:shikimate kinase
VEGHLWLIGMMGSGKTAVGAALATRLGRELVDTDAEVVARTGCSIAQLWGERGEAAFRAMEAMAVQRAARGAPSVVATGGGVVLDVANTEAMRQTGRVVWLTATPETSWHRVGDGEGRPLLTEVGTADRLAEILEARRDLYAQAADFVVATDDLDVEAAADQIEAWWNAY